MTENTSTFVSALRPLQHGNDNVKNNLKIQNTYFFISELGSRRFDSDKRCVGFHSNTTFNTP